MRLRLILLVISLIAVMSASIGGALYYRSLKQTAVKEAEQRSIDRVETIQRNLSFFLSENIRPARAMAGIEAFKMALDRQTERRMQAANAMLDHFRTALGVEVCYLIDRSGNTIASSNRDDPDSFVGENFHFRPYVRLALAGRAATYLAVGATSGRRGVYSSHPVPVKDQTDPGGIVVIKASIERIENQFHLERSERMLVASPRGIVFISSREEWRYGALSRLSEADADYITASKQFASGPWQPIGLAFNADNRAVDGNGNRYLYHRRELENFPGWHVVYLQDLDAISKQMSQPLIHITKEIIFALCFLVGVGVAFLYGKANIEIRRREEAESALRASEERYRSIYHNAPAMLHSVNTEGRLVRVSDHWLHMLGYEREAVIGLKLSDFLSRKSARHMEETVMPQFLKTGSCHDVPYRYVRKNQDVVDTLLSAVAERDAAGRIIRSLAVSVDVTDRRRAEEDLKEAKEALSRYSRELERQVRVRTKEIASILKYTPDVVYIKDAQGRYLTVNRRFEELFGGGVEDIRGKTADQFMKPVLARQFQESDARVLSEKREVRVENQIPHPDGLHTYLSVKFPIWDDGGRITGVGGISTDITAVKKAQEQLRRLSGSIMADQEQERRAIARELHDELGQMLTALRMEAVWIRNRLKDSDPGVATRASDLCGLIDKTIGDVRSIAIRLRPGILDDLGLVDALEWYTDDFEKRTGITCIFEHRNVASVDAAVATTAYRIVQEALTNVARHADARNVDVVLKADDGRLDLTVTDDGCGFDFDAISEGDGLGLAGMRERAALVGGRAAVRSMPGEGVQVLFELTLSREL